MLAADDIATAIEQGGLQFQYGNVYFTKAVLEDATPDESYVGEFGVSHEFEKKNLNIAAGNNAKVTFTYRLVSTAAEGDYWLQVTDTGSGWTNLLEDAFVEPGFEVTSWGGITLAGDATEFTFTISEEAYAALVKLALRVKNVVIEDVKIEAVSAEPTPVEVKLDETNPEADAYGNRLSAVISADTLKKFEGDIKFTISYVKVADGAWYNAITPSWTQLVKRGSNTSVSADSGELVLVLAADDIATAIEQGGLQFQYGNVYFTKAVLEDATPDESYVGEFGVSHEFEKKNLNIAAGNNAKVTFTYRLVSTAAEGDYWLQVTDTGSGWTNLLEDAFVEPGFEVTSWGGITLAGDATEFTFTISEEAYAALVKLALRVKNVVIESVKVEAVEAAKPVVMATDTYDFRDGSIIPTTTDGKSDVTSGDLTIYVGTQNAYYYHGTQYGVQFKAGNSIAIDVNGDATIEVSDCQHNGVTSLTMTSADGSWTQTETAKVSDSNVLTFEYEGEATTLTLDFTGSAYVSYIKVTMADLPDPVTYDFSDGSIVPSDTTGKNDVTSGDLTIKVGSQNAYAYNGQHGTAFKAGNSIEIVVNGAVKVDVADCQYNDVESLTMTNADGTWSQKVDSTGSCSAIMTFNYDGDATTLVLGFDNTAYITSIKVTPLE